jgi:predicted  nucleic acid-binding Zn-ribbon protein
VSLIDSLKEEFEEQEERIKVLERRLSDAEGEAADWESVAWKAQDRQEELEEELQELKDTLGKDFEIALKLLGMTKHEWELSRKKLELW